ncbi:hypothetical protein OAI52_00650 [Gammaproteobacteria bacterium]|nr:hypothetical protein [Gammaproteobacteria bacterium]MDC0128956.1 hypothetical protein [Gammaproteobacteria bacterium]
MKPRLDKSVGLEGNRERKNYFSEQSKAEANITAVLEGTFGRAK